MNEIIKNFIEPGLGRLRFLVPHLHGRSGSHLILSMWFYVWIDALLNYALALGYGQDEHANFDSSGMEQSSTWLGKDILCVPLYLPIILMMLDIKLP